MGRHREPVDLILAKGRSHHINGDEEQRRRDSELHPPCDHIEAPDYLTEEQKKKFYYYADRLLALRIFSELDVDCLARYVLSHDLYVSYYKGQLAAIQCRDLDMIKEYQNLQNKAFQQATACARDLGLTITSRCRIVIPPPPDDEDDEL